MSEFTRLMEKLNNIDHCYVAKHKDCGKIVGSILDMKDRQVDQFISEFVKRGYEVVRVERKSVGIENWCSCKR